MARFKQIEMALNGQQLAQQDPERKTPTVEEMGREYNRQVQESEENTRKLLHDPVGKVKELFATPPEPVAPPTIDISPEERMRSDAVLKRMITPTNAPPSPQQLRQAEEQSAQEEDMAELNAAANLRAQPVANPEAKNLLNDPVLFEKIRRQFNNK